MTLTLHKSTRRCHRRSVGLFGGTFDPIHAGHIAVAEAAHRRFHLDTIYFIPSSRPPHKTKRDLAPFLHRYAMVALACADHPTFIPSVAEAPLEGPAARVLYHRHGAAFPPGTSRGSSLFHCRRGPIPGDSHVEKLRNSAGCVRFYHRQPSGIQAGCSAAGDPARKARAERSPRTPNKIVLRKSSVHLLAHRRKPRFFHRNTRTAPAIDKEFTDLCRRRVEEYILGQALYR